MPEDRNEATDPIDPIKTLGDDATATFETIDRNPTDRASSEALDSATDVPGEGDPVSKLSNDRTPAI